MKTMNWIDLEKNPPKMGIQCLVYDPTAVIKCYTAFFMPYSTTEKAGIFHVGGTPLFGITHYIPITNYPKNEN